MESWRPQEGGALEVCNLLQGYLAPGANQSHIWNELQRLNQYPDFSNYLAFILCAAESQPLDVRQAAGLVLKNNLKLKDGLSNIAPAHQAYIKSILTTCIGSPDKQLRSTVGIVVSVILQQGGLQTWPEIFLLFAKYLESNDFNCTEGAMDALSKLCEDMPEQLDTDIPGLDKRPIDVFFPQFLKLFSSPQASIRRLAVLSANQFIISTPRALIFSMDNFLTGLFSLASDPEPEVRKLVCSGIVQMVTIHPDYLEPQLKNIVDFMLHSNQESNTEVVMEATEFWSAYCDSRLPPELIVTVLPTLIPVLMGNMRYEDDDDTVIEAEEESNAPEKEQDLKPRFHKSKLHGGDKEDDEGDDEYVRSWNLRKCSAACLDNLSLYLADSLLPTLMPTLERFLAQGTAHGAAGNVNGWKEREVAVLALGAISEGCLTALLPMLPQILPWLLPLLQDPHPLVRAILCWTLSRYSSWLVQCAESQGEDGQKQFDTVLLGLLHSLADRNRRVQEAACSALADLEHEAQDLLVSRIEPILKHLVFAFNSYQRSSLLLLYETIRTLADSVGQDLNQPQHLEILMPPLAARWQQLPDSDRDLLPLLECFHSIALALGSGFAPYAETVFVRCTNMVRAHLQALHTLLLQRQQVPAAEELDVDAELELDSDTVVCCLELISALVEAWPEGARQLIARSDLPSLLVLCCQQEAIPHLRQAGLAVVGDMAKTCLPLIEPQLQEISAAALDQLTPARLSTPVYPQLSVSSNACWALGEVLIAAGAGSGVSSALAQPLLQRLVPILSGELHISSSQTPAELTENCGITLGRLAAVCPQPLAPHLPHFLQPWCRALRMIRDGNEKEDAFRGLCSLVSLNPSACASVDSLSAICMACGCWKDVSDPEVKQGIIEVLHGFKKTYAGLWSQCMSSMEQKTKDKLFRNFGV